MMALDGVGLAAPTLAVVLSLCVPLLAALLWQRQRASSHAHLSYPTTSAARSGGPPSAEALPPPPRVPPVVPGLPVLGSALALGSGGAAFLQQCRKEVRCACILFSQGPQVCPPLAQARQGQFLSSHSWRDPALPAAPAPAPLPPMQHGDAFTLRLLGQRMTFVFAPATLCHYFTAPDTQLTFAPAVQQARTLTGSASLLPASMHSLSSLQHIQQSISASEWPNCLPARLSACPQFTHRVFGLPPRHFYSRHLHMLQASCNCQQQPCGVATSIVNLGHMQLCWLPHLSQK